MLQVAPRAGTSLAPAHRLLLLLPLRVHEPLHPTDVEGHVGCRRKVGDSCRLQSAFSRADLHLQTIMQSVATELGPRAVHYAARASASTSVSESVHIQARSPSQLQDAQSHLQIESEWLGSKIHSHMLILAARTQQSSAGMRHFQIVGHWQTCRLRWTQCVINL